MGGLQSVENEAMRIVTGAAKPTSCETMRFWLGLLSIRERRQLAVENDFLKAVTVWSHPLHQHLRDREDTMIQQRLKTVRSWVIDARESIETFCSVKNISENPWIPLNNNDGSLGRIGDRTWMQRNSRLNTSDILEWLDQEQASVVIATDGSIRDDVTAWGGAVWKEGRECFTWSTARHGHSSSFHSEAEAFENALVWCADNTTAEDKTIILTDSLSLVNKMEGGMIKKSWTEHIKKIKSAMHITYIPGHAGIPFNEKADQLAGEALPIGVLDMEPADITAALKKEAKKREIQIQQQYWSTE